MKAFLLSLFVLCWTKTTCKHFRPARFSILAAMQNSEHTTHKRGELPDIKSDPTGMVGQIMSAAKNNMAAFQKKHEEAVRVTRKNVSTLLQEESTRIAKGISKYDADLHAAISKLQEDVTVATRALDHAAQSANRDRWDASSGMENAKAQTQLKSVKSCIATAELHRTRDIESANLRAAQLLEHGVEKLSFKLGDMSELVSQTQGNSKYSFKSAPPENFVQISGKVVALNVATARLRLARTNFEKDEAAAKSRLDRTFEQVDQELLASTDKLLHDFEEVSKVEMAALHR